MKDRETKMKFGRDVPIIGRICLPESATAVGTKIYVQNGGL